MTLPLMRNAALLSLSVTCVDCQRPGASARAASGGAPASAVPSVIVSRFPAPSAEGVCADALLRLSFSEHVSVGSAGTIRVFDERTAHPVDIVDLATASYSDTVDGRTFQQTRPIFADGNELSVHLRSHALAPNHAYFVTVDAGVFIDAAGRPVPAIVDPRAWRFSTGEPSPDKPGELSVSADGDGDFCTIQGAVDYLPAQNQKPVTIAISSGIYHEMVFVDGKSAITFRGGDADPKRTTIAYANNEKLQGGRGAKYRAVFSVENADRLVFENLTIHNLTPQGGSQAEALRIDPGDQIVLKNDVFLSLQDTLLLTGRVYAKDCTVAGNVDFVWGKGTAYFDHCAIQTVGRAGYVVQARNDGDYGYVFVDSKLSADPGITGNLLGRVEADRFPRSSVAYIDCQLGPDIDPAGWFIKGSQGQNPDSLDVSSIRFWEYHSVDANGQPLDVSRRHRASRQISASEAEQARDRVTVLEGWDPGF
ncbi:MAG TPA: pectinesterase family protein [Polyangiaceae bacterium]